MYGLFPALMESQRFRADQEQRAAEMAMRQQDQAMRQRQMAMQEEQHRLQSQEMGLRLGRMKDEDAAGARLADLQQRDAESQRFDGTGLMRPVDDREMNTAIGGLAAAKRDVAGMVGARNANRMLDVQEEAKRLAADPAFQEKAMNYISTKEIFPLKVVPGQRDPKSGRMKTADRLEFDSGFKYELKDGDRQRIALGAAMMSKGMTEEGLKVIEGVNKELRDAVDHANKRTVSASEFNSKADDRLADNELRAEHIAAARAARAAAGAGKNKELPPAILKELSDLEQKFIQADPKERPAIERQYQMVLSRAGAALGKPMGLPNARPPAPDVKVNQDGSVIKDGMLYVPNPKKPGEFMPAKGMGPSNLDRALEAYQAQGGAPAPAAAPAPARPQLGIRPTDAADTAESAVAQARQNLQRYGLRQRQADPQGYAQAVQQLQDAERAFRETFDAVTQGSQRAPAFRYPTP